MSRELDILAHEFKNEPIAAIRTDINIYQTTIQFTNYELNKDIKQAQEKLFSTLIAINHI